MTSPEKEDYHDFIEINRKFMWILRNFSSFSDIPGTQVKSRTVSHSIACPTPNAKWQVVLFPNGWDNTLKGYVSLRIKPLNYFEAYFKISAYSSVRDYNYVCIGPKLQLNDKSSNLGAAKLIKRDILLTDLKKGNGLLTIVVKIVLSKKLQEAKPQDNLLQDIGLLLKTKENSDVILISGDGIEHKAHKTILMCRSKVFSAMFNHNMKESQDNIVRIEDLDNNTLKAVLHFLYTGELLCTQDETKNVLIAADKYELNVLKRMCIDYLHLNMRYDNIMDLIEFADKYNFGELKIKAKKYFLRNYKGIVSFMGPDSIKNLSRSILEELFHNVMENV